VAKDCLEAGLHTLLVKPLTPTTAEGRDLVNLAEDCNLYGAVEFHKRWDRSNLILRDKIKSGELGTPLNCWVEYSQRKSIPLSFFKEWASKTSILQYLGVHYIDIVRFITAALPKRVMAVGQKSEIVQHGIDAYDAIQCFIEWEMPDGVQFTQTILTSWVDPESSTAASDQKIKFIGTKGRYEADQKERGIRINTDNLGAQHINPDFCMQYGTEDGDIHWQGYGIESITTFLNDVVDIEVNQKLISEFQTERPSFKESLISTMVVEAAHLSLENKSNWQLVESLK
jgi:predicted dehydrogenase